MTAAWWFRPSSEKSNVLWDWEAGAPSVRSLAPVRPTRSSEHNRHIPVTAYSVTTGGHLALESGLEHDLLRRLDRLPSIVWLVAQPVKLGWTEPIELKHTPDLMSLDEDGFVTIWDAKSDDEMDETFVLQADMTRTECAGVGWRYEIFSGLDSIERLNLLWLHGYRRRPPWHAQVESTILAAAVHVGVVLADLFTLDDRSGETKASVWHLVWNGRDCCTNR